MVKFRVTFYLNDNSWGYVTLDEKRTKQLVEEFETQRSEFLTVGDSHAGKSVTFRPSALCSWRVEKVR